LRGSLHSTSRHGLDPALWGSLHSTSVDALKASEATSLQLLHYLLHERWILQQHIDV
jgi:hypothetical protein